MTDDTKIRFLQRYLVARNKRALANVKAQNAVMRARMAADDYRATLDGLPEIFHAHCNRRHDLQLR